MLAIPLVAAFLSTAAASQPEGTAPDAIVVTGERVKRTVKETPSSVVVFQSRDIDRLAAPDRLAELLELTPNVLVESRRDTPVIRGQISAGVLQGLPAFLGGARPRTVVQLDGRTITFNEFQNSSEGLWDVDRVEIFRSPETTTQGVNSIAGAIFINTADPTFDWEGRARLIGGELERRQASAVVSGPLVGDQLAFRIAGDLFHERSSNRLSGPVVGIADLNDDHYGTLRAKLLAQPSAVPGLKLVVTYAHSHSQAPQVETARPPIRDRRDDNYIFGYFKADVDSLTAIGTYPIADGVEWRTTLSRGKEHFRRFAPQGFGQTQIHGRDGSLESLVDWKAGAVLSGVAGVSWQELDLDQCIDLTESPLGIGTFDDRQVSRGLFGEVTWHPAPRFSLTGGARYQIDSKNRTGLLSGPNLPLDYQKTNRALLPKASAAYDVNEQVRIGLLAQRAYNPGGVTLDPASQVDKVVRFDPEYLWDYEAYVRAGLFGGALTLNGNLFYNDVTNAQRTLELCVNTPTGCVGLEEVSNAPRSHSSGAEVELRYRASPALTIEGAGGLLYTKMTKTLVSDDPSVNKQFYGSPHFSGTAAVEWQPLRSVRVTALLRHVSGYFGDDSETGIFRIKASNTVNARASWERGRLTVFAYAQNLFDSFHVSGWNGPHDNPDVEVTTNDPREVGIGVEARF
jgi:outer membrane receptor protein involved in Fe transport